METFLEYCRNYIIDHLGEYEGQSINASEIGWTITQGPNIDGTLTYNRSKAIEYLQEWWWECADYFDYEKSEFGEVHNPFDNPEAYMVCMVIEGVNDLMYQCNIVKDHWDESIELTEEVIGQICKEVENYIVSWTNA